MPDQGVRRPRLTRDDRAGLVLDTAEKLFYARGVRAVGMDELVRETGLSKMSVYRVFATKDELVGAYLDRRAERLLALIDAELERHAGDPAAALHGIMDAVAEDVARPGFRGCPFNNASAEFEDAEHPARVAASAYKAALLGRLAAAAERLAPARGAVLAGRLALVIDGMYLSAGVLGPDGPAAHGRALGGELIDAVADQPPPGWMRPDS
jgi:AcrR family transcriptional regulator